MSNTKSNASQLTQDVLKQYVSFSRDTGVFIRIKSSGGAVIGDIAGTTSRVDKNVRIGIAGKIYLAHRLAWLYEYGEFPKLQIDHIDGNPSNNSISNLRIATNKQNKQNQRKPYANNKSGFLGVSRWGDRWRAQISVEGKRTYLGFFYDPEEAHVAYVIAKRQLHQYGTL